MSYGASNWEMGIGPRTIAEEVGMSWTYRDAEKIIWDAKHRKLAATLAVVESKQAEIRRLRMDVQEALSQLPSDWVIRHRSTPQDATAGRTEPLAGHSAYLGPDCYADGPRPASFCYSDPTDEGVLSFRSPVEAMVFAKGKAKRFRDYATQKHYVIEVVDRTDGEVYAEVPR